MATPRALNIFTRPAHILSAVCPPVTFPLSNADKEAISHLKMCFKKNLGQRIILGLAAPQAGLLNRFFIVPRNLSYAKYDSPRIAQSMVRNFEVFINPNILEREGEEISLENCLSVEGEYRVKRAKSVKMEYWSPEGERLVREFSGKLGLIVQHERDHLDGITIDQIG